MAGKQRPASARPIGSSASSERRQRVIPMGFQIAGLALNGVSLLFNEWASSALAGLWFTVFKTRPKPWVENFWANADERFEVSVGESRIPVYGWGQGPTIVTMHGWSGSGTQFRAFIPALVNAGFRVLSFDAPAHGTHPGRQSDLLQFSGSLQAIERHCGELHAVIGHSMGGMATVYAIRHGLRLNTVVLVAPHLDVRAMFATYSSMLGMRPALAQRFNDKIGLRMQAILGGEDPWASLNPEALLTDFDLGGLLVHDRFDPEIEAALFADIERLWQNSAVYVTENLGHNRLLKNAAVVDVVVDHLRASTA